MQDKNAERKLLKVFKKHDFTHIFLRNICVLVVLFILFWIMSIDADKKSADTIQNGFNNNTQSISEITEKPEPILKSSYKYDSNSILSNNVQFKKKFVLGRKTNPKAKNLLYYFIIDDMSRGYNNDDEPIDFSLDVYKQETWAVFYDLNEDGENEIIGINGTPMYMGSVSGTLFILHKAGGKYLQICTDMVNTDIEEIRVLNTKSNGFHDIGVYKKDSKLQNILKYN